MTSEWEKEFKARQSRLEAVEPRHALLAAVRLWQTATQSQNTPSFEELLQWLLTRLAVLESDLVTTRSICDGFASRIAAQSELLSKRAEHAPTDYRRKFLVVLRKLILAEPESRLEAAANRDEWGVANGDCVCFVCQEPYFNHPQDPVDRSLVILCDRSRVKL